MTRGLPRQHVPKLDTPVAVPNRPSSVVLLWVPSRKDRTCVQRRIAASQAQAQALADDINTAPVIPRDAVYNCPSEDGTQVLAYFRANDTTTVITVALSGCPFISDESALPRTRTQQLNQLLGRLAPGSGLWRSRLG